jgi:hypothetical protein
MTDQDWIFFEVHARDAAVAAHVAMWLREHLPAATVKSAPDEDMVHMDVLHCSAAIPERTATETEQAVDAALRELPDVGGPDAAAQVVFNRRGQARAA